jgi:uncharacterized membrane protein
LFSFIHTINWNGWPAKVAAVLLTGVVLGLFWVFTDLVLAYGTLGWIMFAIALIPLYAIGEKLSDRVLSVEAGQQISDQAFSWKRIGVGLFLVIGVLGTARTIYFLMKH